MRAINIIKTEHRNLAAVLYSLEKLIGEIDSGKQAEFSLFHGLLTYINRFLDRYHHPKEDNFLFPILRERAPDMAQLIERLSQQHSTGEILFNDMLKSLSAYEFCGDDEYPRFRETVLHYVEFERDHAFTEERELLPRAIAALQPADWEPIDAAFGDNEDPMFTKQWRNEFSGLFSQLVNRLPAPLGLGEVWKQTRPDDVAQQ